MFEPIVFKLHVGFGLSCVLVADSDSDSETSGPSSALFLCGSFFSFFFLHRCVRSDRFVNDGARFLSSLSVKMKESLLATL